VIICILFATIEKMQKKYPIASSKYYKLLTKETLSAYSVTLVSINIASKKAYDLLSNKISIASSKSEFASISHKDGSQGL
jgi:hypothetical protein